MKMTAVNVLIYTDKPDISFDNDSDTKRVWILRDLLETQRPGFAEFKLRLINRYEDFAKPQIPENLKTIKKLTKKLLQEFDEIWFFGLYQKKMEGDFTDEFGGPENELDGEERRELEAWMASGGVLMAGDHSEFAPGGKETDPRDSFLCLGRALGRLVPRAGQLRRWDGPPTANDEDSFNTLVRTAAADETTAILQEDDLPQSLILAPVTVNGLPHRLFLGDECTIDVFPDHKHEGELRIPDKLDSSWPPFTEADASKKPKPVFVAHGSDKRTARRWPVLAVYDGDKLGVGRIVADSSWHHYLNVNLRGFKDTSKNSTLDLLRQFFRNLAFFLAPRSKREQMSREMLAWLVNHSEVQEEKGNHPESVGKVALHYLAQVTTGCERDELIQIALGERLKFSSLKSGVAVLPSQELVLGSIINCYYRTVSQRLNADPATAVAMSTENIISQGVGEALDFHRERLKTVAFDYPDLGLSIN